MASWGTQGILASHFPKRGLERMERGWSGEWAWEILVETIRRKDGELSGEPAESILFPVFLKAGTPPSMN